MSIEIITYIKSERPSVAPKHSQDMTASGKGCSEKVFKTNVMRTRVTA